MLALCSQVTFNIRFSVPKKTVTTRNPRLFWVSVLQALVVDFKDVNKEQEGIKATSALIDLSTSD